MLLGSKKLCVLLFELFPIELGLVSLLPGAIIFFFDIDDLRFSVFFTELTASLSPAALLTSSLFLCIPSLF
jgi:hypothetical protein